MEEPQETTGGLNVDTMGNRQGWRTKDETKQNKRYSDNRLYDI